MAENWFTYLLGNINPEPPASGDAVDMFQNSRLMQYFNNGNTLLSRNQVSPFSVGGPFGRPRTGGGSPGAGGSGGGSGGSKPPPPPPAPPPVNPGTPPWAFPQYTQTWAFTPPTPFVNPPPPVFNKANYPATPTTPVKK